MFNLIDFLWKAWRSWGLYSISRKLVKAIPVDSRLSLQYVNSDIETIWSIWGGQDHLIFSQYNLLTELFGHLSLNIHHSYSVGMSNFVCPDVDRAISGKTETRLKPTIVKLVLNMVPVK